MNNMQITFILYKEVYFLYLYMANRKGEGNLLRFVCYPVSSILSEVSSNTEDFHTQTQLYCGCGREQGIFLSA
jgi:hypothetical protein